MRLFKINQDLDLLSDAISKLSIREMAKLVIPENLKNQAKLKFVDKGGKNRCNNEEIIDLCCDIKEVRMPERKILQSPKLRPKPTFTRRKGET